MKTPAFPLFIFSPALTLTFTLASLTGVSQAGSHSLTDLQDIGNPPAVNYSVRFGGDGDEVFRDQVTDGSGNIYCAGSYSGPVQLGSFNQASSGLTDMLLVKMNAAGTVAWARTATCTSNSSIRGTDIALDGQGNVYIAGSFDGPSAVIGSSTLYKTGITDAFVAKYDAGGVFQYAHHYGIPNLQVYVTDLAVDGSGILYLTTQHTALSQGAAGGALLKMNPAGTLLIERPTPNQYTGIAIAGSTLYLAGTILHEEYFGFDLLIPYIHEAFVAQSDLSGNFSWALMSGQPTAAGLAYNEAEAITADAGGCYLAGLYRTQTIWGTDTLSSNYGVTAFLVKVNPAGQPLWAAGSSGYGDGSVSSVFTDDNNDVYLAASSTADLNWGGFSLPSGGDYLLKLQASSTVSWLMPGPPATSGSMNSNDQIILSGSEAGNAFVTAFNETFTAQQWSTMSNGNSGEALVYDMVADADGNTFSLAYSDVPLPQFGNVSGTFLLKLDPVGNFNWSLPVTGGMIPISYWGRSMALDKAGNILIVGSVDQVVTIGTQQWTNPLLYRGSFVAKITQAGTASWIEGITGTGDVNWVVSDNLNNVIICGTFNIEMNAGPYTFTPALQDVFMVKYSPDGTLIWAKQAGGEDIQYMGVVSCDAANNIYLAGEFLSRTIDLGNNVVLYLTEEDGDVLLAKYSPDGNCQWASVYGTPGPSTLRYYAWPTAIETLPDGTTTLLGWTGKDHTWGNTQLTSPFRYNKVLVRIDPAGNVTWARIIKEKSYDFGESLDVDESGNCYFSGNIHDTTYFENSMVINQGQWDMYLAKYNNSGNPEWVKMFPANLNKSYPYAIAVYDTASIFLAGKFINILTTDVTEWSSASYNGILMLLGEDINASVQEPETETGTIRLYPNPAGDRVTLSLGPGNPGRQEITVFSAQGERILTHSFQAQESVRLDISGLEPGVYLVRMTAGSLGSQARLVVVR